MAEQEMRQTIRIATRASALALWQANYVAQLLRDFAPGQVVELLEVSTHGDRDRQEPLSSMGGQGVFTREVQKVVLDGGADIAVHSLKDLPTERVLGLTLAGVPARASRYDALLLRPGQDIQDWTDLPQGSRIGTGSLRRRAQLLHLRPDLQFLEIRGNLDTRLAKLDAGEYDAIILAEAGLTRLQMSDRISVVLQPPVMFPAVGQAALGIECRDDDGYVSALLERLSHQETKAEVLAERACLSALRAGCHAPVGTLTAVTAERLDMTGVVLSPDGSQRFEFSTSGETHSPEQLGRDVAAGLLAQGAGEVLIS